MEPSSFPAYAILAMGMDHVRLCAVWHIVPMAADQPGEFGGQLPDLYEWGMLADVAPERVRQLWPVLRDLGAIRPDRTVAPEVRGLLVRRAKELLEDKPGKKRG